MTRRRRVKLVREGHYAAEVEVELIEAEGRAPEAPSADAVAEGGWAPYLSLAEAQKLDEVREALRRGELKRASQLARVFTLTPLAV